MDITDLITFCAWLDGNHNKSYSMDKLVEYQQWAMKIVNNKPELAGGMIAAVRSGQLDTTPPPPKPD